MFGQLTEKEIREQSVKEAKRDLIMTNAAIGLVKDNNLACEIHINGVAIGLCRNDKTLPALKFHKKQIELFLDGKENIWE